MILFNKFLNVLSFFSLLSLCLFAFTSEKTVALFNISMGVNASIILIDFLIFKKIEPNFNPKNLLIFTLIFFIFIISVILNQEGFENEIKVLKEKIKWIIIPFLFCYSNFKKSYLLIFSTFLFLFVFFICVDSLINFYNYNQIIDVSKQSFDDGKMGENIIPFKILHHLFAIILVINCAFIQIYLQSNYSKKDLFFWCYVFFIFFFSMTLHFTGSRVGMLAFYISSCLLFLKLSKNIKKTIFTIFVFLIFSSVLFLIVVNFNQSIRLRLKNTTSELTYILNTDLNEIKYSGNFTARIVSIRTISPKIKDNFWKGDGLYFYHENLEKWFDSNKLTHHSERAMPPNQFVRYSLSMGVPLTIVFYLLLFSLFLFQLKENRYIIFVIIFTLFLYTMTETPLDPTGAFLILLTLLSFSLVYVNKIKIIEN